MQRLMVSAVLTLFALTPVTRAWCAAACETPQARAAACHERGQKDPLTLAGAHDCSRHAAPSARLASGRVSGADLVPAPGSSVAIVPARTLPASIALPPTAASSGGPPRSFAVPLRT